MKKTFQRNKAIDSIDETETTETESCQMKA